MSGVAYPAPDPNPDQVSPIPRRAAIATDTEWWRAPFILSETRGRRRRELAANRTTLEAALADAFAGARAEYYPGGMVHAGVKPTFVPLEEAMRRVRGVAGTAARTYLQLNLTPERWAALLELASPNPNPNPNPTLTPTPTLTATPP